MTETATAAEAPRSSYDPFAMDSLQDVHRFDGELRETGPVVYIEKHDFYAITQFAEIQKALRDWRKFSSTSRPFYQPSPFRPTVLLLEDPPDHTASKAVINKVLSAANLARIEEYFRSEAERLMDELLADGPVELNAAHDLAIRYVLKVFPDVLGLPEDGRDQLLRFGDAAFNAFGPPSEHQQRTLASGAPAIEWVEANTAKELQGEGSIGWELYQAADEGKISELTAQQMLKSIFAAGFDTTTGALGSAFRALADNPDEYAKLRRDPELVENAWEESIRYYPASRFGGRWAPTGAVLGGVRIPEGAKLLMMWLGAGRDSRRYDRPDEFHVDRDLKGGHLSFGFGIHSCAGAAVARLEARSLLRAFVDRVESIELVGEPHRMVSYQAFGHTDVPVRLVPGRRG